MLGGRDYLNATRLAQSAIQVIEADREESAGCSHYYQPQP